MPIDAVFETRRAEWIAETRRQLRILEAKLIHNEIYGWFDSSDDPAPAYDPPHNAPCLYCGLPILPTDVRTHSVMLRHKAERSYFYRTHRSCDEAASEDQKQSIMGSVLDRIGHDLGLTLGEPVV